MIVYVYGKLQNIVYKSYVIFKKVQRQIQISSKETTPYEKSLRGFANRQSLIYVVEYIYNALRGYRLNKICERITYLMCFILLLAFIIIVIRSL